MTKPRHISKLHLEFEREDDGRWIAEIPTLPGVMAYGATQEEARNRVEAIALRTLADRAKTGKKHLRLMTFLWGYESVASHASPARLSCTQAYRLVH